jgi:hypothetical protein
METLVVDLGVLYPMQAGGDHTYVSMVVPRSDLPVGYREWSTQAVKLWMFKNFGGTDPKYMSMYWAEHRWGSPLEEPVDVCDRRRR